MELLVRNTLGRRLERFEPWNPPRVRMYVCGPTPYDYTHIGHARTFVAFDAIKRYLSLRGYDVLHIQNITDIDDKIIRRSRELGVSWREVADRYTRDYLEQLEALRIRVDVHPRVTDHIGEIMEFVERLVEKGYAYVAPSGSVYFEVDKYPRYGELSGRLSREQWRQEEEYAREKRSPYDFALWKAAKPEEPSWPSPWGPGRPGWHIECSVMSTRYAGGRLDIHGGAADLIFPHHENERAQSEAYLGGSPWVRYWLHTGYLTIEGEKMSKSLGNIIVLRDAIRKWGAPTLRLWLLTGHYRAQLEYSEQSLRQAARLLERLRGAAQEVQRRLERSEPSHYVRDSDLELARRIELALSEWHREMSTDFNFAGAARWAWELTSLYYTGAAYSESGLVLGLLYRALSQLNKVYAVLDDVLAPERAAGEAADPYIDLLVEVRRELRRRRMYDLADMIRSRLNEMGIVLLDYRDRTEWRRR